VSVRWRQLALFVAAACAAVLPGCPQTAAPPAGTAPVSGVGGRAPAAASPAAPPGRLVPASPTASTAPGSPGAAGKKNDEEFILLVKLGVGVIEAPVGTISSSEQAWSYLNEEPVAIGRSASLGRNGLRIGTGSRDNWPDLAKVLKRLTGRSLEQTMTMAYPGALIPIELKRNQPVQTIFTIYEDRTMGGQDYPPGDNLLTLSCTFDLDDPKTVLVTGLPQIRSTHRSPKIVHEMTSMILVEKPAFFSFSDLTFQLRVANNDFLVIGPGAQSRRPNSVGRHFLVKEKDGVEFESILILTPEIVAAPVRKSYEEVLGGMKKPN